MSIVGITAEYDPFHAGHAYQIRRARELSGADHVVVLMSGFFTQRGEPAIYDPYRRTRAALEGGADAVFMMPVSASTASAEGFASCGIRTLSGLGCDAVSFGVETGKKAGGPAEERSEDSLVRTVDAIQKAAEAGLCDNDDFGLTLRQLLKEGKTYPEAMAAAMGDGYADIFTPNNILAVEYMKALRRIGPECPGGSGDSKDSRYPRMAEGDMKDSGYPLMKAVPVERIGHGYADDTYDSEDSGYPSASALRKHLKETGAGDTVTADGLVPMLDAVVTRLLHEGRDLTEYADVSPEIAGRIAHVGFIRCRTWEEAVLSVKTRQYTYARISRCLMHILLDIKKDGSRTGGALCGRTSGDTASYVPPLLLGFRRSSSEVLSELTGRFVSKPADAADILAADAYAADIYGRLCYAQTGTELPSLYASQRVII